jgi:hypothetical protein
MPCLVAPVTDRRGHALVRSHGRLARCSSDESELARSLAVPPYENIRSWRRSSASFVTGCSISMR